MRQPLTQPMGFDLNQKLDQGAKNKKGTKSILFVPNGITNNDIYKKDYLFEN